MHSGLKSEAFAGGMEGTDTEVAEELLTAKAAKNGRQDREQYNCEGKLLRASERIQDRREKR
jgi:hypothetical protein